MQEYAFSARRPPRMTELGWSMIGVSIPHPVEHLVHVMLPLRSVLPAQQQIRNTNAHPASSYCSDKPREPHPFLHGEQFQPAKNLSRSRFIAGSKI